MDNILIGAVILAVVLFVFFVLTLTRYKRCSPDNIMVVSGLVGGN
jgi:uncharacterized membrane protein YqiK